MKENFKNRFTAKKVALMAMFVALAFGVSFLEFPIFPATPFLQFGFGNVFILLISFLLGPLEGVIVCVLKESLRLLTSGTGGVGEIANMLATTSYILFPAIVYQRKKGLKVVIFALLIGCILGTSGALLVNRFINFPLYMGAGALQAFQQFFFFILAFNLIKTVSVSLLTVLLYKRISNVLKKLEV